MMQAALDTVSSFSRVYFPETHQAPASQTLRAFGQELALLTDPEKRDTERRLSELETIYEPALASRALPKTGFAIDIGAAEGWFGLAFAKAFPEWRVLCLEADNEAFARLQKNVENLGLVNVTCLQAGIHPSLDTSEAIYPQDPAELESIVKDAEFVPIPGLPPRLAPARGIRAEGKPVRTPAISPSALTALGADLVKIDAPYAEADLANAFQGCDIPLLIGRLYEYVPSSNFMTNGGAGELYLEHRGHVLRRDIEDSFTGRRPGLDIVVAMYNTRSYIQQCVDSLLADGNPAIRVLVVDDGSTDGSGDLVDTLYRNDPRVRLLRKANGGCASARNYGRRHSDAAHIAFLDADDRVDPGMFTALLETARYTGAYVAEAEFAFLDTSEDGTEVLRPSYEADLFREPGDQILGDINFLWREGHGICIGQPTIWRRVHRRDFLDHKNIWFPEHVRAFDDQIFQFLVGQYCGALAHVRGFNYHYRQHPDQDIKQGDERHFYSFNMFRSLVIRSLDEGWPDVTPLITALLNTIHWSYHGLRDDLKEIYLEASAKFLAILSKTYGHLFTPEEINRTGINGLEKLLEHHLSNMRDAPVNYGLIRVESWHWQPEMIRMMQSLPGSRYKRTLDP